jgi:hypothetical protein
MARISGPTAAFAIGVLFSLPAHAQSFCDLVPAATVKAMLHISDKLVAAPDTEWGNGCDYSIPNRDVPVVEAIASDDTGMDSIALTNHADAPNDDDKLVTGVGEAAIYTDDHNAQDPSTPSVSYTRQSLIFRQQDKIVDFVVMTTHNPPPESAILSLGKFISQQPVDNLKDPPN